MNSRRRRFDWQALQFIPFRISLLSFVAGLLVIVLYIGRQWARSPRQASDSDTVTNNAAPPIPALRPSRFLNTRSDAQFVGTEKCIRCHVDQHQSFLQTPHSRALGLMKDRAESVDECFVHASSTLVYSIVHQDNQTRHRIVLKDVDGAQLSQCEFPVKYRIGSGNHSVSYLIQEGDFLFESPLTWYQQRGEWGLSPGFDALLPRGFDRIVDNGCLICHAGRVESIDENRFRSAVIQETIGCESCHGPGSLHVQRWKEPPQRRDRDEEDVTIVNPRRLQRDEAEQVCAMCHLRGDATVAVRGRRLTDFRPGLRLSDFRIDFFATSTDDEMTVTGHVRQMRQSKCYRASPQMTCTTCHDPHHRPTIGEQIEHYRQACLSCHVDSCGLPRDSRLQRQPDDNCIACHMPRTRTDIPHFAFTHHRVGLHQDPATSARVANKSDVELLAEGSVEHLLPADRYRCIGLAYVELAERRPNSRQAEAFRERGRQSLRHATELGICDAATLATLAGLEMEFGNQTDAVALAQATLREANLDTGAHENARFVLANAYLELNKLLSAEAELMSVVSKRRRVEDWILLAEIRHRRGDSMGEGEALRVAEQLNPFRPDLQKILSKYFHQMGQIEEADRHQRVLVRLLNRLQNAQ